MNLMDVEPAIFESDSKPLVRRYVLAVGLACFGFWFFDYVMRGWFGGTPSFAVSLRHTFIIAICLVFVVGFLIKDRIQKIKLSSNGIETQDAGGKVVQIPWSEVESAILMRRNIVCRSHGGQTIVLSASLSNDQRFVDTLISIAGESHRLTVAAKQAFIDSSPKH